jgi:hypothetical protein
MRNEAGLCGRGSLPHAGNNNRLIVIVIACCILIVPEPTPAVGPDLLHEEIGVDYDELATNVQEAYAKAWSLTLQASRLLFPDDGDEFAPDAADAAKALYESSIALIRETESRYSQAFAKIPLLFVQLEYLVVKNMSGMAAILSYQGDLDAAHAMRLTLIGKAEEHRGRIAYAIERNILPQFHSQYREVDNNFRKLLAESYVWIGADAETVGNVDMARANYIIALELSAHEEGREAIHALLDRLDFMHQKTVLTAGGEGGAPDLPDLKAADELPPPVSVGETDTVPTSAGASSR